MASLLLRWSEHEARKAYARPFMVTFVGDDGEPIGSIGVNGSDLLYWRQFAVAVAALTGELFIRDDVDSAADPQRVWLRTLAQLMPAIDHVAITPSSTFDHERGRVFTFEVACGDDRSATVDARTLLEYQELQAAVAHQCGMLLRVPGVEGIDDPAPRQRAWLAWLRAAVSRPSPDDAMALDWPWR